MKDYSILVVKHKNDTFLFSDALQSAVKYNDVNNKRCKGCCLERPFVSLKDLKSFFKKKGLDIGYNSEYNLKTELNICSTMHVVLPDCCENHFQKGYSIQRIDAQDFTEKQLIDKINMFIYRDRIDLYSELVASKKQM